MTLLNLREILTDAQQKRYGIIAINTFNFDMAEAVIGAAEEKKSPIVLMVCEVLFKYFNFEKLMAPILSLAKDARVPVALSLDHGNSFEIVVRCIKAGCMSVMFDGSRLDLDENIRATKEITQIAHVIDISVEAEVGRIGGSECHAKNVDKTIHKDDFTKVEDAVRFVKETHVDALAVAVGTIHGHFRSKPNLDFERIKDIRDAVEIPLVLHGSSGLSDDDLRKAVKNGITKINYWTNLITEATKLAREISGNGEDVDYMELNYKVMVAVKEHIKIKMDVLDSSGKG